jgi:hypothetical protein
MRNLRQGGKLRNTQRRQLCGLLWESDLDHLLDAAYLVGRAAAEQPGHPVFIRVAKESGRLVVVSGKERSQSDQIHFRWNRTCKPARDRAFVYIQGVSDSRLGELSAIRPFHDVVETMRVFIFRTAHTQRYRRQPRPVVSTKRINGLDSVLRITQLYCQWTHRTAPFAPIVPRTRCSLRGRGNEAASSPCPQHCSATLGVLPKVLGGAIDGRFCMSARALGAVGTWRQNQSGHRQGGPRRWPLVLARIRHLVRQSPAHRARRS